MTEPKALRHNSKPITKKNFLHPVQKKILLYLANNDPKDKNEVAEAIKGHYKSTWNAFNKLEEKNLIKIVSSKSYQGQEYPRYWLSPDGAFIALCEGAKPNSVIRRTNKIYPENKDLHYLLDSVSIIGNDAFNIGYLAIISKGKLEQSDMALMMITQLQKGLSDDSLLQFNKMLKKYPDQEQKFTDTFKKISENLQNLNELFLKSKTEKSTKK